MTSPLPADPKLTDKEWIAFPGGELEAPRPRALCPDCRATRRTAASLARKTLCFRCYRMDLDRQRGIKAAAELNTASEERFQATLPFEPVDRVRLMHLRAMRSAARVEAGRGIGKYADRRRKAQISARHALERIAEGLRVHGVQSLGREVVGSTGDVDGLSIHGVQSFGRKAAGSTREADRLSAHQAPSWRAADAAVHAAELQLPATWLPYAVGK